MVGYIAFAKGGTIGIYAIVDKVVFEPDQANPERIRIWGVHRSHVPGSETVTFTNLVGHKVEVTGVLIPAGKETKVKSKTEIERECAPDVKIEQRTKTDEASMPHFRVVSVKQLPDPCTP